MSNYDMNTVNELWNAGYDLGQIIKERKSYPESIRYLQQLNYYRENNYQRFKEYLFGIYADFNVSIPECVAALIQNGVESYKYSVIFCMGYIGKKKIKEKA